MRMRSIHNRQFRFLQPSIRFKIILVPPLILRTHTKRGIGTNLIPKISLYGRMQNTPISNNIIHRPSRHTIRRCYARVPTTFTRHNNSRQCHMAAKFRNNKIMSRLTRTSSKDIQNFPMLRGRPMRPQLILSTRSTSVTLRIRHMLQTIQLTTSRTTRYRLITKITRTADSSHCSRSSTPSSQIIPSNSSSHNTITSVSHPQHYITYHPQTTHAPMLTSHQCPS